MNRLCVSLSHHPLSLYHEEELADQAEINSLAAACYDGNAVAVRRLLKHGVDVNAVGVVRYEPSLLPVCSPLQAASYSGHDDVVHILLESGADYWASTEVCRLQRDSTEKNAIH